jgi:uncharacterized BrkB/YihY/UPF0761 family membrane protein
VTSAKTRLSRERVLRTLTFWLRPAFVLRALTRFQRVAGFDRAVALGSSAFTALIPLGIVFSAILPQDDAASAASTIINRYHLNGSGASAINDLLTPAGGTSSGVSVLGAVLLVFAVLSFSRAVQRLFEQTWELKPLSVRNTLNDLIWIVGLAGYMALSWWVHDLLDHGRVEIVANLALWPAGAAFLAWSGWVLSAKRIPRGDLTAFGIIGAGLLALYLTAAAIYVPHLFNSSAARYGVIGAVLAMISVLFAIMLVLVASAVIGREVAEELSRIRRGERPPDDEIRREWDGLRDELRSHWQTAREQVDRRRSNPPDDRQPH